jgi:hypothetical protein
MGLTTGKIPVSLLKFRFTDSRDPKYSPVKMSKGRLPDKRLLTMLSFRRRGALATHDGIVPSMKL